MIRRLFWKKWIGMNGLKRSYAGFYLLALPFCLLFSLFLCLNSANAVNVDDLTFVNTEIFRGSGNGSWTRAYYSDDYGGPIIDLELSNGGGVNYQYLGKISYEQAQVSCSGNTLYPVYTLFGDNLRTLNESYSVGDGFGPAKYNVNYYYQSYYRSHFVLEDSETGRGFAYGVYLAGREKPKSTNNSFSGVYQFTANFGFFPYNATSTYGPSVPINLEILGVNSFCSEQEAKAFVDNYIFQDTRPDEPGPYEPVINPDFPYSYDSDDSDNNKEIYNVIFNQNSSNYEPDTGDAKSILNWLFTFIGKLGSITDDPNDYRCNVLFYPNTTNLIKFDWNGYLSYSDIRFNACDNAFVYALNDDNSIIGSDSGTAFVQSPGAGTMFFVSLKGIIWLGCFWLVFKMLRSFYYYVYDIIAYSFNLGGSGEGEV